MGHLSLDLHINIGYNIAMWTTIWHIVFPVFTFFLGAWLAFGAGYIQGQESLADTPDEEPELVQDPPPVINSGPYTLKNKLSRVPIRK